MIGTQPVPLTGGVNSFQDPVKLPDDKLQPSKNLVPRERGFPGTRESLNFVREVVPDWRPWNSDRSDPLVAAAGAYHRWARYWKPTRFMFNPNQAGLATVLVSSDTQNIVNCTAAFSTVADTVNLNDMVVMLTPTIMGGANGPYCFKLGQVGPVSMFSFLGVTYVFGGDNSGCRIENDSNGTIAETLGWNYIGNTFAGENNSGFSPRGAAVVRDRVVYWKGPEVFWSDRDEPLSLPPNAEGAGGIHVTGEELEDITAAAELSTSADGSPVQSVVGVWTRSRMFMLLGEPAESDEVGEGGSIYGSLQINKLNIEAGCVSQASITRTPYGVFWVGMDDVWFMPFGQLPIRVGTAIRDRLKAQPTSLAWKICADYSKGFLRVSLFSDGQGPTAISPLEEQWWLDLNNGPPQGPEQAQWWGPQVLANYPGSGAAGDVGVFCMARDLRSDGDNELYSLHSYVMSGNATETIYGMSLCAWNAYNGQDVTVPVYESALWKASYGYYEGDILVPPATNPNFGAPAKLAPVFVCTTTGLSGTTEPNWYTAGTSVTDGAAVWKPIYYAAGVGITSAVMSGRVARHLLWKNSVDVVIRSKEYTLGDPIVDKLLDGAELGYIAGQSTKVEYSTNPDQTLNSKLLDGQELQTLVGNEVPLTLSRNWRRKFLSPESNRRFSAQTGIVKLAQKPGIVIVAAYNDHFSFDAVGTKYYIDAGYYANITELFDAIKLSSGLDLESTIGSSQPEFASFAVRDINETEPIYTTAASRAYPLMQLLGFRVDQPIQNNAADPSQYLAAAGDLPYTLCPDLQISALNLRFGAFGRRSP